MREATAVVFEFVENTVPGGVRASLRMYVLMLVKATYVPSVCAFCVHARTDHQAVGHTPG